jgi:hypothetical protein
MPFFARRATKRSSVANQVQAWTKSSFSYANSNCVEVAGLSSELVRVRDSKNPKGPVLQFTSAEWRTFLSDVRNGEFDPPVR